MMRSVLPDKQGGKFSMEEMVKPLRMDSGAAGSTGIIRKQINRTF